MAGQIWRDPVITPTSGIQGSMLGRHRQGNTLKTTKEVILSDSEGQCHDIMSIISVLYSWLKMMILYNTLYLFHRDVSSLCQHLARQHGSTCRQGNQNRGGASSVKQ